MSFREVKSFIGRYLLNMPGWRTNRKIVVFESDDWGSIRMPSREVFECLLKMGIPVDQLSFNRYDSLESEDDLSYLFEVLHSIKDMNGNSAVFTANMCVANPDFEKIASVGFKRYYYEPFTETYKKYPNHCNSFALLKQGIQAGVFHPQYHGREHINVPRWLFALQQDKSMARQVFSYGLYDLSVSNKKLTEGSFMDSLNYTNLDDYDYIKESIADGAKLFENIFNFRPESFIAPCYIWDSKIETFLADCGIRYLKGSYYQKIPIPGKSNKYKLKFHYTGQKNTLKQRYLVRNVYFEPSDTGLTDEVNKCLFWIDQAFKFKKPAIICTHRLNYIGSLVRENREKNLLMLQSLLKSIIKKHPNTEFLTALDLGNQIDLE